MIEAVIAGLLACQFHAEARLVVVDVSVRGPRGEVVTDLGRDAFTVYENGRQQPVSVFLGENVPVSVGLVIDTSGSMRDRRDRVEAAALAFVRASNPLDEMFLVNFADRPRIDVPLTTDAAMLEAGLSHAGAIGGTALRDAIDVAGDYLAGHARHQRRVLLVVSDGRDNASTASADDVKRRASLLGIAVYAIGLPHGTRAIEAHARHALDDLTRATGGTARHLESLGEATAAAIDLALQIRRQYTLGYIPTNPAADGTYRRIRVTVKAAGATVRARPGYVATSQKMTRTSK